jgi:hypothetical protein
VFALGDEVEVLSPDWAAEEFRQRLAQVSARYGKFQNREIG